MVRSLRFGSNIRNLLATQNYINNFVTFFKNVAILKAGAIAFARAFNLAP